MNLFRPVLGPSLSLQQHPPPFFWLHEQRLAPRSLHLDLCLAPPRSHDHSCEAKAEHYDSRTGVWDTLRAVDVQGKTIADSGVIPRRDIHSRRDAKRGKALP